MHGLPGPVLDRGELERLVDAESSYYGERGGGERGGDRGGGEREHSARKPKSKKRSFLENLFESEWRQRAPYLGVIESPSCGCQHGSA